MIKFHSDKRYRKGVGIILINNQKKVFVGKRKDINDIAWQLPQGGIERGELPYEAAVRELKEETSVEKVELIKMSGRFYRYDLPNYLKTTLWRGRYRGQEQVWFLFKHLGLDSEIDVKTQNHEFVDWKWIDLELLPDIIVDFKKELYRELVIEFLPIIKNL